MLFYLEILNKYDFLVAVNCSVVYQIYFEATL